MLSDSLVESFRSRLEVLGLELADLRIGGTPQRPLVHVRIEWPPDDASRRGAGADCAAASRLLEAWLPADGPPGGPLRAGAARRVSVAACAAASRLLEAWLDADGPLGRRYVLEVSSPGLERPLRWHQHWVRFVGREVQATVAGLGRVRARIVAVPDEATVVLQRDGAAAQPIPLARIRAARLAVDW